MFVRLFCKSGVWTLHATLTNTGNSQLLKSWLTYPFINSAMSNKKKMKEKKNKCSTEGTC